MARVASEKLCNQCDAREVKANVSLLRCTYFHIECMLLEI